MQRDLRLDTIRGLLLILITINHFASLFPEDWWGWHFTWQPLGYVSAAEGFVFLSGFTFSLVYTRYAANPIELWRKARERALLIYWYHLTLIFSLTTLYWLIPAYHTMWTEWLTPYPETPFFSTIAILCLFHQPPYFDILPMYALFVCASPLVMVLLHRRKHGVLIALSLTLWLLGQFVDPLELTTTLLFPSHRPGHFNLLSWQLLYVFGLILGNEHYRAMAWRVFQRASLRHLVLCGAVFFFLSRHLLFFPEIVEGIDRPSLQWTRLGNFFLLTVLVSWVLAKIPPHAHLPWFTSLGQHSLQVFSFHIAAFYLLLPTSWYVVQTFDSLGFVPLVFLVVACLYIVASFHQKYRNAPPSALPTKPEPAPVS